MEHHVDIVLSVEAVVEEVGRSGVGECEHCSNEGGGDPVHDRHVAEEEDDWDDGNCSGCVLLGLLLLFFHDLVLNSLPRVKLENNKKGGCTDDKSWNGDCNHGYNQQKCDVVTSSLFT